MRGIKDWSLEGRGVTTLKSRGIGSLLEARYRGEEWLRDTGDLSCL